MKTKCAHPACNCQHEAASMVEEDGEYYCSSSCAKADHDAEQCHCGHKECGS